MGTLSPWALVLSSARRRDQTVHPEVIRVMQCLCLVERSEGPFGCTTPRGSVGGWDGRRLASGFAGPQALVSLPYAIAHAASETHSVFAGFAREATELNLLTGFGGEETNIDPFLEAFELRHPAVGDVTTTCEGRSTGPCTRTLSYPRRRRLLRRQL